MSKSKAHGPVWGDRNDVMIRRDLEEAEDRYDIEARNAETHAREAYGQRRAKEAGNNRMNQYR